MCVSARARVYYIYKIYFDIYIIFNISPIIISPLISPMVKTFVTLIEETTFVKSILLSVCNIWHPF